MSKLAHSIFQAVDKAGCFKRDNLFFMPKIHLFNLFSSVQMRFVTVKSRILYLYHFIDSR